jgi:hypothetical protein
MAGWDEGRVYSSAAIVPEEETLLSTSKRKFNEFLREFREGTVFIYRLRAFFVSHP